MVYEFEGAQYTSVFLMSKSAEQILRLTPPIIKLDMISEKWLNTYNDPYKWEEHLKTLLIFNSENYPLLKKSKYGLPETFENSLTVDAA